MDKNRSHLAENHEGEKFSSLRKGTSWDYSYDSSDNTGGNIPLPVYTPCIKSGALDDSNDTPPVCKKADEDEDEVSGFVRGNDSDLIGLTTTWIRNSYDPDAVSTSESSQEESGWIYQETAIEDSGEEFNQDYVRRLEAELNEVKDNVDVAQKKLKYWHILYWESRDDYYFSHIVVHEPEQREIPDRESEKWHSAHGDPDEKKLPDEASWYDIQLSEYHLHQLELDLDEETENCAMIESELTVCLRVWNPIQGKLLSADDFLILPDDERCLDYGNLSESTFMYSYGSAAPYFRGT
ncbi:hypothetical protein BKA67DRAFT_540749 [Truncatella angustata]|uniref:Uncharacterized protein n=1 Tax=Truncatella angustata TaxID=152316 RepID=A0A9P8UDE3_9PEZI|nr:uncharacterized protein BKA67DRAFT_540749 [Truncatella angustata]KAH6647302.1 hypothetical protein BKA67DRAFT_540749 [Truncatella angustata]